MVAEKQTRRTYKRPFRAVSFKFDENLYNQFIAKSKETGMSSVEALERLMRVAVAGILDKTVVPDVGQTTELKYEFAGEEETKRMLDKLQEFIDNKPEFIPPKEKIENLLSKEKVLAIRFPRFRVEIDKTKIEILENHKLKAVFTDEEMVAGTLAKVKNKAV